MPVSQPISGVKVGASTTAVGTPQVINVRLGIFASSVGDTLAFSDRLIVQDASQRTLRNIVFSSTSIGNTNILFGGAGTTQMITAVKLDHTIELELKRF